MGARIKGGVMSGGPRQVWERVGEMEDRMDAADERIDRMEMQVAALRQVVEGMRVALLTFAEDLGAGR